MSIKMRTTIYIKFYIIWFNLLFFGRNSNNLDNTERSSNILVYTEDKVSHFLMIF